MQSFATSKHRDRNESKIRGRVSTAGTLNTNRLYVALPLARNEGFDACTTAININSPLHTDDHDLTETYL